MKRGAVHHRVVLLASLLLLSLSHSSDKSTKSPFYRSEPLTSLPREQPSAPGPPQGSRRGANWLGKLPPHLQVPVVVSAYPELELVRTLGAATHGEDVAHTIVANAGVFATSPPEGETLRGEVHFSQRRRLEVRDAPSARQRSASDLDSKKRWTRVADRASC